MTCGICKRTLSQPGDSDSLDCEGDCWGCVKESEENAREMKPKKSETLLDAGWSLLDEADRGRVRCDECGKRGFARDPLGTIYCGACAEIKGFWEGTP